MLAPMTTHSQGADRVRVVAYIPRARAAALRQLIDRSGCSANRYLQAIILQAIEDGTVARHSVDLIKEPRPDYTARPRKDLKP